MCPRPGAGASEGLGLAAAVLQVLAEEVVAQLRDADVPVPHVVRELLEGRRLLALACALPSCRSARQVQAVAAVAHAHGVGTDPHVVAARALLASAHVSVRVPLVGVARRKELVVVVQDVHSLVLLCLREAHDAADRAGPVQSDGVDHLAGRHTLEEAPQGVDLAAPHGALPPAPHRGVGPRPPGAHPQGLRDPLQLVLRVCVRDRGVSAHQRGILVRHSGSFEYDPR